MYKFLLTTVLLVQSIYAIDCSSYQYDKADYYASKIGEKIVNNKFDGGKNIVTTMRKCEFNSYSKKFKLKVDIKWNGVIWSDNNYEVDGILEFDSEPTDYKFTSTWKNSKLKEYISDKNLFAGTVATIVILGSMDNQNQ